MEIVATRSSIFEEPSSQPLVSKRPILWKIAAVILGLLTSAPLDAADAPGRFQVIHEGYDAFVKGSFEHAGQNLYVSRGGRIQMINRWDLNGDGYYDLVFSNTHNMMVGMIDALGYLQTELGFRSAVSPVFRSTGLYDQWLQEEKSRDSVVRLPAQRPSGILFHDLDHDGFSEVIFASGGTGDTPYSDSAIYWGRTNGLQRDVHTDLPTIDASDVAVADLNHDGYDDLIFANRGTGAVEPIEGSFIYWGTADRYSAAHRTTVPTTSAVACAVGDLDGDNHPDVAFAESKDRQTFIRVFRGTAKGPIFRDSLDMPVPDLQSIRIVTTPEWGLTLLAVSKAKTRLFRLENGRLELKTEVAAGGARAALADLDADGKSDLVLASGDKSLIIWGRKGWSVEAATSLPTLNAKDVAIANLDSDAYPDIVFANCSEGLYQDYDVCSFVYWGKPWGYGVAARSELQTFGAAAVAIGHINRDGKPDILFGNTASGIQGGKNEETYVYWGGPHRGYSPAAMQRYPCVMGMATAMADCDDDGHPELLIANAGGHYSGRLGASYIYWGTPAGPAVGKRQDVPMYEAGSWSVADLNRDGYLDAVASDIDAIVILWGGANGLGKNKTRIEQASRRSQLCRLVDFNRDGWLDIVVPDIGGRESKILLGGKEGYAVERATAIQEAHLSNVEFADLDGDGWLDMILARSYSKNADRLDRNNSWIRIYYGRSDGGWRPGPQFPTAGAFDICVADLNHDGGLDIAVTQYQSRERRNLPAYLFWNDGHGKFAFERRAELTAESGAGLLAADFDEDSQIDLLLVNHKTSLKEDNHSTDSVLFWGCSSGFSTKECTRLPAHGPHFMQNVDVGNLATRRLEESYVSAPIAVPEGVARLSWSCKAETPLGSQLRWRVRGASDKSKIDTAQWHSLIEKKAFEWRPDDRVLQYSVTLVGGRGAATPYMTRVEFHQTEK